MTEQLYWHHYVRKANPDTHSLLRSGAAHLWGHGKGTKGYPDGTGRRRDINLGAEWSVLRRGHGIGAEVKVGTNGSEHQLAVSLFLGPLASLWLHASGVVPYRWLERRKLDGSVDHESRVSGARVSVDSRTHPVVEWKVWAPRDGYSRAERRWWREGYVDLHRKIFGPTLYETLSVEEGTCVVPMPEANYPATWQRELVRWRHTSLLGHLRDTILGPKRGAWVEIKPGKPVPVPGKGENSWDCDDDDAINLMSCAGTSIEDAIGSLVASALRTRRRHGGDAMNIPAAGAA